MNISIWSFKGPTKFILFKWLLVHTKLSVRNSLKGNVIPNLRQYGFCHEAQEIVVILNNECRLPIFMGINDVGSELHSSLIYYEANDVQEATSKAGAICPGLENNNYNNVMGIMEMSMQPNL